MRDEGKVLVKFRSLVLVYCLALQRAVFFLYLLREILGFIEELWFEDTLKE